MDAFIEIIKYTIPAALMLLLTYLLLSNFVDNEEKRRQFYLRKDLNKKSLPMRFQAFERLTVFLERITPNNLVLRVKPGNMPLGAYRKILVNTIRQEYDYNVSQQVYISDKNWNSIVSAKSQVVSMINKVSAEMDENATAADLSRKLIELEMTGDIFPTKAAILLLKHEAARNF
ncbi:MAG: hypothetical protein L7U78_04470 [Schleiferiaceae bacterium]|nr:hypothetical protein [Schleiferiaceae bacterium]